MGKLDSELEKMSYDSDKKCYTCRKNRRDYTSTDGKTWFTTPTEVRVPKTSSNKELKTESILLTDEYMHAHMKEALYTDTQGKIKETLKGMTDLLLYKNQKYGDSALKPLGIFTKHIKNCNESTASILVRLDDKLSRVKNADSLRTNDVADILGYCTLLLISMGVTSEDLKKFMD